ncbi:MAG: LytTR family transcriptional regulator DNA-binding domain-containing protein [Paenibacillaceae bacterium]
MNAALETRNMYEDFVLEKDILYFRTGHHGLVSFHGKNFNVRRKLSTEQLQKILVEDNFYKVNTDCYVNIMKVKTIQDNRVYFESLDLDAKSVPIDRLKHHRLKVLLHITNNSFTAR